MPIARQPTTYECVRCGWKETIVNGGDVVIEGVDMFTVCPKCKCDRITARLSSKSEKLIGEFKKIFH